MSFHQPHIPVHTFSTTYHQLFPNFPPTNMIQIFFILSQLFTILAQPWSQALPSSQGQWQLLHASIGISPMHMQLLHNNKVIMFDRTDFGPSNLSLPRSLCRIDTADTALQVDCTAHSILYDVSTNTFRPLQIQTDTWCSSGTVLPNGTLIQTGGFNDGDHVLRSFTPCNDGFCNWKEFPNYLSERRWYATNQVLPDGRIIILGGRRQFNYEFYPKDIQDHSSSSSQSHTFYLHFLRETRDSYTEENNLYPFIHLLPDGNLFIFANTKSVLLDYKQNRVLKQFPSIPDNIPRNYPSSGSSVLLPIDDNNPYPEAEILICGGATAGSFIRAIRHRFRPATSSCGRLKVSNKSPTWVTEEMPMARVMGDMLILPTGDIIIINGAEQGTAGWECAQNPVTRPVIYKPNESERRRFDILLPSPRPRLYHSSAVLLPDGRILISGSNPHIYYNFSGVEYPTDLSLESFSPPYLATQHNHLRSTILSPSNQNLRYKQPFTILFSVNEYLSASDLTVRIVAPSFTTHSFAMNQRMVVLKLLAVSRVALSTYTLTVVAPSTSEIAPPGYYMLFLVHGGVPSFAIWVRIQ